MLNRREALQTAIAAATGIPLAVREAEVITGTRPLLLKVRIDQSIAVTQKELDDLRERLANRFMGTPLQSVPVVVLSGVDIEIVCDPRD